jgi:hypothetical protein
MTLAHLWYRLTMSRKKFPLSLCRHIPPFASRFIQLSISYQRHSAPSSLCQFQTKSSRCLGRLPRTTLSMMKSFWILSRWTLRTRGIGAMRSSGALCCCLLVWRLQCMFYNPNVSIFSVLCCLCRKFHFIHILSEHPPVVFSFFKQHVIVVSPCSISNHLYHVRCDL